MIELSQWLTWVCTYDVGYVVMILLKLPGYRQLVRRLFCWTVKVNSPASGLLTQEDQPASSGTNI